MYTHTYTYIDIHTHTHTHIYISIVCVFHSVCLKYVVMEKNIEQDGFDL